MTGATLGIEKDSIGWSVGSLVCHDDVLTREGECHTEPVVSRNLTTRDSINSRHFAGDDSESQSCMTADGHEPGLTALGLNWWDLLSAELMLSALSGAYQGAKHKIGDSH